VPTKILVADDSATMRRVLEMTFAGEDVTVQTVEAAEPALARAAEFAPDLIFADASMPGVDGYELARRIKADPKLAKTAVVVMASQQAPYDDAKGRAAGVDDHISKPFDTQGLIDRVGQVLAKSRAAPGEAAKPTAATATATAPAPRPAPPAPVAAAANSPAAAAARVPQGTRMGVGAVPLQPAAVKSAAAAPIPALRPGATPPLAPPSAAKPVAPPPARPAAAAVGAVATAASQELSGKLAALGLSREQVEGVLALSREVIEQVVWEVVPELAETLIKEEIKRLTAD
jgi:CheY-like chemotaxis protein